MKTQIKAEIVAHSINEQGDELISVLATFPRIILAEVNTHRMLSKNTSSSRAIPFNKMVEAIKKDPFIPMAWQKEHKGMQGNEYFTSEWDINQRNNNWLHGRDSAISIAKLLNEKNGVTKQLCNRLLEPFMWTTMLITGPKSGWENFFKLRCPVYYIEGCDYVSWKDTGLDANTPILEKLKVNKGQAEIHMMALAECIWDAVNESTPKQLKPGEWHIPFERVVVKDEIRDTTRFDHLSSEEIIQRRVKISVAMAARTSYTVVGEEKEIDYEAMIKLHDRLLAQDPPHSSPLEHCAKCMDNLEYETFIKGQASEYGFDETGNVMKFLESGKGWCNNFKGFIPYRYMIDNAQL